MVKKESTNRFGDYWNKKIAKQALEIFKDEQKRMERIERDSVGLPVQNKMSMEVKMIHEYIENREDGEWKTMHSIADFLNKRLDYGKVNIYRVGKELTRKGFKKDRQTVCGETKTVYKVHLIE